MGIRRSSRNRWIFGVCGGIAHRFGWNPLVVRLVTVLLAIFIPGFSLIPVAILYVILGYLLPESAEY
ncbi:PspC domain-containing protein [Rubrobacter calidifluminis]|uniref:PspC domain-containing protein n=1 Tax=Rubrobacter calidifluminis TaxID=1392640 RepID=UPI00236068E4|nr:PspC domain-containing protein [Rubrobacter calidifluminis]